MARTFHREASSIGLWLVVLVLVLTWACGCSITRWKAEDGHSRVNHGLTLRWGTTLYIGDEGGYTEVDWFAQGEKSPTTQPMGRTMAGKHWESRQCDWCQKPSTSEMHRRVFVDSEGARVGKLCIRCAGKYDRVLSEGRGADSFRQGEHEPTTQPAPLDP